MAQQRALEKRVRYHALYAQTPAPVVPTLLTQSAFKSASPTLMGAFLLIQDTVAGALAHADDDDVMDGFPIPVAPGAWWFTPGWLADIALIGKGGNDRYDYGVRMMICTFRLIALP